MTIGSHLQALHGLPAFDFPDADAMGGELPDPASVAWRITVEAYESDEAWEDAFARFAAAVDLAKVRSLIVGAWSEVYDSGPDKVVSALLGSRDRLPELRALFVGDITFEECEISWINQGDVTPLLDGFPELEEFGVRGGMGLAFGAARHDRLRSLVIESGGLPAEVVRGVAACELPSLERLDLWLGTSGYGGDAELADLGPFLAGTRLPRLRRLALRNSEIQDEIAAALAAAPVVARLEVLDLSMGTLGDQGAAALLDGQPLTHLRELDLHHHFIDAQLAGRIRRALEPSGVTVDLDDVQEPWDDDMDSGRFTAVAE
ncbi:STM4015 family protein [Streptomyces pacificus]|uniref:Leucine-rich repeat domain-containing protein n=1 Tax=Streptomyces pacificus TaxID=2705029 RepID=A0A6A0B0K9_9ACTN|nr:STM4015 family protein [Streptomyces pacificus]GFH38131.1 leucine-rich repeat domain-containing protein [Streptomyces pacificus]